MNIAKRITSYYYEFRYRLLLAWWQHFNANSRFLCDVLMFHHVTDKPVDAISSCKRTKAEFRATLQKRVANGVQFVSMDMVNELINRNSTGFYATVTFDDVPDNFLTEAYSILKELQIPFTLFLTTSFLEKPGYINRNDLNQLLNEPLCTIGAHTLTHPMLRKVDNAYQEITDSKRILEELTGRIIKYMAYPYGRQSSISRKVTKMAQKAGYELAFGTILVSINDISKRCKYYLPRVID